MVVLPRFREIPNRYEKKRPQPPAPSSSPPIPPLPQAPGPGRRPPRPRTWSPPGPQIRPSRRPQNCFRRVRHATLIPGSSRCVALPQRPAPSSIAPANRRLPSSLRPPATTDGHDRQFAAADHRGLLALGRWIRRDPLPPSAWSTAAGSPNCSSGRRPPPHAPPPCSNAAMSTRGQEALQAGATELAGRDRHLRPAVPRVAEEGRSPEDEGRGRPARRAGRHPGRHRRRAGRHPVSGQQSSVWRSADPEVDREAGGDAAIQDVDPGGDPRELHGVHRHRRQGRAGL